MFRLCVVVLLLFCFGVIAQEDNTGLGYLQAFSVFVYEDVTASNSNTRGRMAVGGDVNLQSYSVGQALTFQCGCSLLLNVFVSFYDFRQTN